jgi:NAD(P)-dependent dehydrogenase (short-subunit alcohol dehydrogenase family)
LTKIRHLCIFIVYYFEVARCPDEEETLKKKACIVFGATGGIGSRVCRLLAGDYDLVLSSRQVSPLTALADELGGIAVVSNAQSFSDVESVFQAAKEKGLLVKAAINCVGSILLKPGHLTTEAEFDETIAQNLKTAFAVVRASAKNMMTQGGSVVLVSSAAAEIGLANHEAIAAAKGGVSSLTRSAAATYASRGIRVNAVAPGLVDTPLSERITSNPRALEASCAMHPLGRIGTAEEVARLVTWLLREDEGWITGQVIQMDGGLASIRGR